MNKKPSVLLVYYEPFQSGQTTHVLSLAQGLSQHQFTVAVVLPDFLMTAIDRFHQAKIQTYPIPIRKFAWKYNAINLFLNLLQSNRYNIVHIHSQEAGIMARILTSISKIQHIFYTPQTIDIRNQNLNWFYKLTERYLSIKTEKIISVNNRDRNRLINWGIPSDKVITIYNGIDLSQFDNTFDVDKIKEIKRFDKNGPLVMQIGRLSAQKNPYLFIDGAKTVLRRNPNTQFVMIGDGPLLNEVESYLQELGLKEHIKLLGWQKDAYKLIPAADIVTLTSRWEGTPYTLLEAMAWSKPVVATDVNGCSEVVQNAETGFLVTSDDSNSWAESVLKLLNNSELAMDFGRLGRERVEKKFNLKTMIDKTEQVYMQALN